MALLGHRKKCTTKQNAVSLEVLTHGILPAAMITLPYKGCMNTSFWHHLYFMCITFGTTIAPNALIKKKQQESLHQPNAMG